MGVRTMDIRPWSKNLGSYYTGYHISLAKKSNPNLTDALSWSQVYQTVLMELSRSVEPEVVGAHMTKVQESRKQWLISQMLSYAV